MKKIITCKVPALSLDLYCRLDPHGLQKYLSGEHYNPQEGIVGNESIYRAYREDIGSL
jgi:hypothetical protein